jgi:hypothetical protein
MTTSEPLLPLDLPQTESEPVLFATPTANERPNRDLSKRIADKRQIGLSEQVRLMSSAAASPARTSQRRGREPGLPASGRAYGQRCAELLARYDPATQSWRTSQLCLDGALAEFSETWPRSGMTRNGTAYQLPPLVHLTAATASGLWPTPHGFSKDGKSNGPSGNELGRAVNQAMWPTPVSRDKRTIKGAQHPSGWTGAKWLCETVGEVEGTTTGSLNPTWVEWLMGFPEGWTALEL